MQKQNLCHRETITCIILNHLSFDWRQFCILDFCQLIATISNANGWTLKGGKKPPKQTTNQNKWPKKIWGRRRKLREFGFRGWLSDLALFPLHPPIFLQFLKSFGLDPQTLLHLLFLVSSWEHWERAVSSEHWMGWNIPLANSPVLSVSSLSFFLTPSLLVGERRGRECGIEKALVLHKMPFFPPALLCPLHCSEIDTRMLCHPGSFSHKLKTQHHPGFCEES